MKIEYIRVVDLTPEQLARCRELSHGDEGYMCEDVDIALMNETGWKYRYSQAVLISEGDKIVGWSLLQPVYRSRKYLAQFFVDPDHRGMGYGTKLLDHANRWCKAPLCYIDDDNQGFFEKFPALFERYEEKELF